MDAYKLALLITGAVLLGAAWLPHLLERRPFTVPMVYVAAGAALYALPLPLPSPDPLRFPRVAEQLTELAVLLALVGAGLRIDTKFGSKAWRLTWRLLGITMPLTIVTGYLLGTYVLGLGVASAVLLGAALAPTDPVLAGDVQVYGPGKGGEDPVRFTLTSEAGLNDAFAFPFVWLAVALALDQTHDVSDWMKWTAFDVVWRVVGGAAIGSAVGYMIMHVLFRNERTAAVSNTGDGLTALAITLTVYGTAELCHTYGFLAVFVAAVVVRQQELHHHYHETLNLFAEQCERLFSAALLILFGGAIAGGVLIWSWHHVAFAFVFVLVVRPLLGWLGLWGSESRGAERWAIAGFGVRGVGSLYYVSFASNHATFPHMPVLWSLVCWVIVASIVIHGFSAKFVLRYLDRRRGRPGREPGPSDALSESAGPADAPGGDRLKAEDRA